MKPIAITSVEISQTYKLLSTYFGFNNDERKAWLPYVTQLVEHWLAAGQIEVFTDDETEAFQAWGRAKDTNSVDGSSPSYTGLHHARVSKNLKKIDPLLVITFEERKTDDGRTKNTVAVIHTMISHNRMFGDRESGIKKDPQAMKALRKDVRAVIDNPELAKS